MYTWMSKIDPSGLNSVNLVFFHDLLLVVLIFVVIFVSGMIIFVGNKSKLCGSYYEKKKLEFIWTVMPILIVSSIFFPSVLLLNSQSKFFKTVDSVMKIMGHQWNWEYDYFLGKESLKYVSVPEENSWNRLLTVSAPLFVKSSHNTIFKVLSEDVIHSFSIPELSLKIDAVPGRVKEILLKGKKSSGLYSGQCSEICGMLHSKMPMQLVFF